MKHAVEPSSGHGVEDGRRELQDLGGAIDDLRFDRDARRGEFGRQIGRSLLPGEVKHPRAGEEMRLHHAHKVARVAVGRNDVVEAKREGRILEALGIIPESIGAVVPSYLWRFRKSGQFRRHTA